MEGRRVQQRERPRWEALSPLAATDQSGGEGKGDAFENRARSVQETSSIGKFNGLKSVSSATGAEIRRVGSE